MSKSGLFAHFGAKEDLQIAVLRAAQQGFSDTVLRPACTRPRGIERLRAIIQGWLSWSGGGPELPGGCVVLSAFHEFDDQPGPVRSQLLLIGQALQTMLARAVGQCLESGDLPPETDIAQVGFDLFGIVMAAHLQTRLFSDAAARDRAQSAIERLLRHPPLLPSPPA
jgi:AcrR family transcriptional regulator